MSTKLKLTLPLALTIAVLAFLWVEFAANFSFHWVTDGSLGNGLDMPAKFHLIIPAAFLTWGMFFVLGANTEAAKLVSINVLIGAGCGLLLFFMIHEIKQAPDFWGISLSVGIIAFVVVMLSAVTDLINVPTVFVTFAGTIFWWLATGADGWVPGSPTHSPAGVVAALAAPHHRRLRRLLRRPVDPLRFRRAEHGGDDAVRRRARLCLGPDRRAAHADSGGRGRRPARRRRAHHARLIAVHILGPGVDS